MCDLLSSRSLKNTKSPLLNPSSLVTQKKTPSSPLPFYTVQMNRNLVGSIYMYGRFCIKFPQSRMKGE